jgi:paraquat-inducible protein B
VSSKTNHWKLGLFVVSGFMIAFGSLVWLGQQALRRQTSRVTTYFDESVQGLDVGSPAKFRGVVIGSVVTIGVAPDKRHVEVQIDVFLDVLERLGLRQDDEERGPNDPFVPENVRVQLASAGITGVKFIQVDFFDPKAHPPPRLPFPTPWAYVPAAPSTLKSLEESLTHTLDRLPALSDKVTALIDRIDETLVELQAGELSRQAQALMTTADAKLQDLDVKTISDRSAELLTAADETLVGVRSLIEKVEQEDGPVFKLLERLDSVAVALEEAIEETQAGATTASLRETSEAFGDVAREASGLGDDLKASLVALREAAASVRSLADALERDPASLLRGVDPADPPPVGGR